MYLCMFSGCVLLSSYIRTCDPVEASLKEYIPTMSNRKKTPHKSSSLRSLKRKRSKKGSMSGRELDSTMGIHHRSGHSRNTSDISGNVSFASMHANAPLDPCE